MKNLPTQIIDGKEFRLYPNNVYFTDGRTRAHIWVWKKNKGEIPKGFDIHHKDENPHNNNIENLELIERKSHQSYHVKKRFSENPEWAKEFQQKGVKAAAEKMTTWRNTVEGKDFHKKIGALSYAKAEYKEYICQQCGKTFSSRALHKGPESKAYPKYCHLNCRQRACQQRKRESRV